MVQVMDDLANLVAMTEALIDQSQNNFDVILDIVSTSSRIIREGNFTDTELAQVYRRLEWNTYLYWLCKFCSRLFKMYQ